MTDFAFTELVPNKAESTALGATATNEFSTTDVGKAVKLSTADNHILATNGDEIGGFVNSVEPFTVNDGYSFGGIQKEGRKEAVVGANQVGTMAIDDLVVADTQVALGTAGAPKVKTGTPTRFLWRCIKIISGTGVAGDTVLLERI